MKHGHTKDEGHAAERWLVSVVPGLSWIRAGFPRLGVCFGCVLVAFWLVAWPLALPLHFILWLSGVDLLRKHDTWELWEERAAERVWRRQMDGALRHETL